MPSLIELAIEGHIAKLTLRNLARRNAMTRTMWRTLRSHMQSLASTQVRCIVVAGEGGHFCAGGDISEYPEFRFNEDSLRAFHEDDVAPALHALLACDVPLVAQIEGNCMGGGLEIAACCDIRIAGRSASFGAPIAKLGMPMAPKELTIVLRAAGESTVRAMLLEAHIFSAQEMAERGFVQQLADDCDVPGQALAAAQRIAALSPQAAALNKQLLRQFLQSGTQEKTHFSDVGIDKLAINSIVKEEPSPYRYAASAEHIEGIQAFLNKRQPKF